MRYFLFVICLKIGHIFRINTHTVYSLKENFRNESDIRQQICSRVFLKIVLCRDEGVNFSPQVHFSLTKQNRCLH